MATLEFFIKHCKEAGFVITNNENWRDLHDCITCNDIRYLSFSDGIVLDVFIENEGVIRDKIELTLPLPLVNSEKSHYGKGDVQVIEKALLTEILTARGFKIKGYELQCRAGKADLIAEKEDLTVIGEVGACRITKVLDALATPPSVEAYDNTELWHLPYPELAEDGVNLKCQLFMYKRGKNWQQLFITYNGSELEALSKALDGN